MDGGVLIQVPDITTAEQWCEFYGVTVVDGVATLYKAVGDDYRSGHGVSYAPGTTPEAPDWDGGRVECGGGLHFSPRPWMAKQFAPAAARYVACPVRLDEIAVHHPAVYPQKVKARRVCAPCFEVDADGNVVQAVSQ